MKKLRLDDLAVESFPTSEMPGERGTVVGRSRPSQDYYCTLPGEPECAHTTGCMTYGYTCWATCMYNCVSKNPCPGGGGGTDVATCQNCGGGGTNYPDFTCGVPCASNNCEPV